MAEKDKVLANLIIKYPIEGANNFTTSLKKVNEEIEKLKENAKGLDRQLSGIFKETTQAVQQAATRATKGIASDLEKQLAKIDADLTSLGAKSQKIGVSVPGLREYQETIRVMRDMDLTAKELTQEQKQAVTAAQRFADIHKYNLRVLESESKILNEKKKTAEMVADATAKEQQAKQLVYSNTTKELEKVKAAAEQIQSKLKGTTLEQTGLYDQARALENMSKRLQDRLQQEKAVSSALSEQTNRLKEQLHYLQLNAKQASSMKIPSLQQVLEQQRLAAKLEAQGARIGSQTELQTETAVLQTLQKKMQTSQIITAEDVRQFESVKQTLMIRQNELGILQYKVDAMAQARKEAEAEQIALLQMEDALVRTNMQLVDVETRLRARGQLDSGIGQRIIQQREEIKLLIEKIRLNKQLTDEERKQVNELVTRANITKNEARTMEMEMQKARKSSETFWERRMGWFIAGSVFYGGMKTFKDTLKTIGEVEMGMTEIARVTNDATFSFNNMRDELLKLAYDYGTSFDQVQQITLRWVQSGYNVADALELTKNSLLALNTAELNVEQATSGLIAIMAQWGLQADELLPVIDKINKVADDYAITSTDLVDGLTRSSGAAKVLGLTLEETISILTVMKETTGRAGKEVGNALNSILSFIQRPKTIELFETEGIKVWADETQTSFRNVIDIFDDLASRWPQLNKATQDMFVDSAQAAGLYSEEMAELAGITQEFTDAQQRDLSQATAGIYRRNYLLALLQNWGRINEVLITQEDALGYSMRENERTMATYQKQVEQLGVEITKLQVALGDSGLLGIMKILVQSGTKALEIIGKLPPEIQSLIVNIGALMTGVVAIQAILKTFSSVQILKMGGVIADQIKIATAGLTGIQSILASIGVFVSANKILLAGVAIVGTLMTIYSYMQKMKTEMMEQSKAAAGLLDEYRDAEEQLSRLTEGTEEYNRALDRMAEVKRKIVSSDIPGVIVDGQIDISVLEKAAEEFNKTQKEIKTVNTELQEYHDRINTITKDIDTLERQKELIAGLAERHKELNNVAKSTNEEEAIKAKHELIRVEESLIQIIGEDGLARLRAANFTEEAINIELGKIDELISARGEAAREQKKKEREMTEQLIRETRQRLQAYTIEMMAIKERLDALRAQHKASVFLDPDQRVGLRKELEVTEEVFEHYKDKVDEAGNYLGKLQENLNRLGNELDGTSIRNATSDTDKLASSTSNVADAIRNFIDAVVAAADAVGLYNTEIQRMIDLTQSRVDFFGREKAGYDQQIRAAKEQANILTLLREKQKGIHDEAEKVREAITKLEARQGSLNRSTEDGKRAFAELSDEIERLKQRANELGIEWWRLQEAIDDTGLSTEELTRNTLERRIQLYEKQREYLTQPDNVSDWKMADTISKQLESSYIEKLSSLEKQLKQVGSELANVYQERAKLNPGIQTDADTIRTLNEFIDRWEQKQNDLNEQLTETRIKLDDLNNSMSAFGTYAVKIGNDIQDHYKRGLIDLQQAIDLMRELQQQPLDAIAQQQIGAMLTPLLRDDWTQQIEDALERGERRLKRRVQRIDDDITDLRDLLSKFNNAINDVFNAQQKAQFETTRRLSKNDLLDSLKTLEQIANGKQFETPFIDIQETLDSLPQQANNVAHAIKDMLDSSNIPTDSVLNLNTRKFADALTSGVFELQDASDYINDTLRAISEERTAVMKAIDAQIQQIQDELQRNISMLDNVINKLQTTQQQFSYTQTKSALSESLAKIRGESITYNIPTMNEVTKFIEDALRNYPFDRNILDLDSEEFAQKVGQELDTLEDARQTVTRYLEGIRKNTESVTQTIESQIKRIKQQLEDELAILQAQLDALEEKEKLDERAKATEEHNKRMKRLQDDRTWYILKGEEEYAFEIAAIDKQLKEEQLSWQEQLNKWALEDEKERIREEMEAAKERARVREEELQQQKDNIDTQSKLLEEALNNLNAYIESEIQQRSRALQEKKALLEEETQAELNNLNELKNTLDEKYNALETALNNFRTYVDNELAEWQRLADRRREIEEEYTNDQIKRLEEEKKRLQDHWNNEKDGIRKIMEQGVIDTLADMAAHDPEFFERGENIIQEIIDGIDNEEAFKNPLTATKGIRRKMYVGLLDTIKDMASFDHVFYSRGQAIITEIMHGIGSKEWELQSQIDSIVEEIARKQTSARQMYNEIVSLRKKAWDEVESIKAAQEAAKKAKSSKPSSGSIIVFGATGKYIKSLNERIISNATGSFLRGPVQFPGPQNTIIQAGEAGGEIILPLSRAIPVLSESLMIAISNLQTQTPEPRTDSIERAIADGLRSLGGVMPRNITVIAQIDGEDVAKKTVPILGKAMRQEARRR